MGAGAAEGETARERPRFSPLSHLSFSLSLLARLSSPTYSPFSGLALNVALSCGVWEPLRLLFTWESIRQERRDSFPLPEALSSYFTVYYAMSRS
jgi:hypothetical protein